MVIAIIKDSLVNWLQSIKKVFETKKQLYFFRRYSAQAHPLEAYSNLIFTFEIRIFYSCGSKYYAASNKLK